MSIWSSYEVGNNDKIDVATSLYGDAIRILVMNGTDFDELTFDEAKTLANKILGAINESA